jgi:hypothetical protein
MRIISPYDRRSGSDQEKRNGKRLLRCAFLSKSPCLYCHAAIDTLRLEWRKIDNFHGEMSPIQRPALSRLCPEILLVSGERNGYLGGGPGGLRGGAFGAR